MELEEAKKAKLQCEKEIREAIVRFKDSTKLTIATIEVDQFHGSNGPEIFNIKVIVNL